MLITEPNRFVAEVHDRMPVILTTPMNAGGVDVNSAPTAGARL